MKVLFLHRAYRGGMKTYAELLAPALRKLGHELDVVDAADWMPEATGPKVDKGVSERLRKLAAPYDLVHAFGYRAAWACGEAFGHKEAWFYTAYDMPRTTHRLLISNLNNAQTGFCSSRAVFRALDEALAIDLATVYPGVTVPVPDDQTRTLTRTGWNLPEDAFVVGGLGRLVPERGFRALIEAMPQVWEEHAHAILMLAGAGPEEDAWRVLARTYDPEQKRIRFVGAVPDAQAFLRGLDMLVVPSSRAGFSMAALEAMACGIPTMVRDTGGLRELVDPDVSGFLFRDDDDMIAQLKEVIGLRLTLETVSHGARIRVLEKFTIERSAEAVNEGYAQLGL